MEFACTAIQTKNYSRLLPDCFSAVFALRKRYVCLKRAYSKEEKKPE